MGIFNQLWYWLFGAPKTTIDIKLDLNGVDRPAPGPMGLAASAEAASHTAHQRAMAGSHYWAGVALGMYDRRRGQPVRTDMGTGEARGYDSGYRYQDELELWGPANAWRSLEMGERSEVDNETLTNHARLVSGVDLPAATAAAVVAGAETLAEYDRHGLGLDRIGREHVAEMREVMQATEDANRNPVGRLAGQMLEQPGPFDRHGLGLERTPDPQPGPLALPERPVAGLWEDFGRNIDYLREKAQRHWGAANIKSPSDVLIVGPLGRRSDMLVVWGRSPAMTRVTTGCFEGSLQEFKEAVLKSYNEEIRETERASDETESAQRGRGFLGLTTTDLHHRVMELETWRDQYLELINGLQAMPRSYRRPA